MNTTIDIQRMDEEQLRRILWEDGIWEDEDEDFTLETVSKVMTYHDLEKAFAKYDVVIEDKRDGKFWVANLLESFHHDNKDITWKEVFPYEEKVTKYK